VVVSRLYSFALDLWRLILSLPAWPSAGKKRKQTAKKIKGRTPLRPACCPFACGVMCVCRQLLIMRAYWFAHVCCQSMSTLCAILHVSVSMCIHTNTCLCVSTYVRMSTNSINVGSKQDKIEYTHVQRQPV